MLAGHIDGGRASFSTISEAVGRFNAGKITLDKLKEFECKTCPTCGSCSGMYTANSMNCLTEALGMGLKGNGTIPAVYSERIKLAKHAGMAVMELVRNNVRPRDIMTRDAFMNALSVDMALGCSTNSMLHLPAIAHECEIEINLDIANDISSVTPNLCHLAPAGQTYVEDLNEAGGVYAVMNELNKLTISKFFQGSLLLPNLVSMVIVSYLVYAFLNPESGLLNNTLELLHLPTVNWYSEPKFWPMILVIVNAWKNAGYASIVYIGSIAGIDPSLYEAARIDGAGKWKQIVRVTLPQLKSTIILMTLLSVGRIFASDFGLFYQVPMDSGALYNVTQTVDTYVYRALIKNGDVGMSAAASLIQSIVGFGTVVTANWLVKKADSDSALF